MESATPWITCSLTGGNGNDILMGGSGHDAYWFNRGDGHDTIQETSGTADSLHFGASITPLDLMLSRQADDLHMAVYGSNEAVTIENWYTGSTNQVETLQAGNGQRLLNTQVQSLIQAMATFSTQTGLTWEQAIAQRPQDVQMILAANWQS
jgi:Ca2+-binding RTX toxin-like protein